MEPCRDVAQRSTGTQDRGEVDACEYSKGGHFGTSVNKGPAAIDAHVRRARLPFRARSLSLSSRPTAG